MSTASEEILARYRKTESVADTLGRIITVRRLRPSQQVAIMRMAESGSESVVAALTSAASVMKIDEDVISFPKTLAEASAIMDRLDQEGLTAATTAYLKLIGQAPPEPESEAPTA
jgi:hypothetical protein